MIRKIVLTNFMAHERSELHLADGLNVLVGPNNVGKSTIAVALKILARNTNSQFVMQHEQKECSILVETSEGHSVEWIKRKSPSYVINGQTKDRLGRGGTPPELDDTLRLAAVEFEDKDFEPHFGEQKSPIFLINRPPSQIAQFFSTTSDAERLVAMQRLHQRQRGDAQNQSKWLVGQNEVHTRIVEALSGTQSLEVQLAELEQDYATLHTVETQIEALERHVGNYAKVLLEQQFESVCIHGLQTLEPVPNLPSTDHIASVANDWELTEQQYSQWSEASKLFQDLAVPPTLVNDEPLVQMVDDLTQGQRHQMLMNELTDCLSALPEPIQWPDFADLERVIGRLGELEQENARQTEIQKVARLLGDTPTAEPTDALERQIEILSQTIADFSRCEWMIKTLESLPREPKVEETKPLVDLIHEVTQLVEDVSSTKSACDMVAKEIAELDGAAKRWLETDPLCSTCGAKLTAESIRRLAK